MTNGKGLSRLTQSEEIYYIKKNKVHINTFGIQKVHCTLKRYNS